MEWRRAVVAGIVLLGCFNVMALNIPTSVDAQDTLQQRVDALEQQVAALEQRVSRIEGDTAQSGGDAPSASDQTSADGLNLTFEGSTDSVTDTFVVQEGILRFEAEYPGDSNFIVHIYGPANSMDLVFNELGPYRGQRVVEVSAGAGFSMGVRAGEVFLEVIAQGPWRITVQQ